MRRDSIARSTPFRLALAFGAMFFAAFLITGATAFAVMRWQMYQRHDQEIRETYSSIAGSYRDELDDFLDALRSDIAATDRHDRVFLAAAADGKVLAGNIPPVKLPNGWSTVPGARLGLEPDLGYRLLAGRVHGIRLVVGQSYRDIDDLEEMAFAGFAWTSIVVALLALAGGSLVGFQAQRRFEAVRQTMGRVAQGELAARIPLLGKGDDIDLLSADINDALARLETSIEAMRDVSGGIAHDLKSPLNRLRISLEETLRKETYGAAAAADLNRAVEEMDQLNQIFDALLRIAQIEAGARRERFKELDLNEALATVADLYGGLAEDNGQSLDTALSDKACIVFGDRELLLQMFSNLVQNAIRHCGPGNHIRIASTADPDCVSALVEDSGPGIPPAEHERVFRRLYRLERSRAGPGSGLGLSLVKAIADLHGAVIRLEDARPGLRASLAFPRR